nr:uncharacterized protein LOC124806799 [Hydra vulgaris]
MKTRLKKKSDIHRTGNKPIKLSASEVKLANLLDTEKNPTFTQIDGNTSSQASRSIPKRLKLPGETKETTKWTNTELQRVVMLEQLKYYRLKNLKLKYTTPQHVLNEEEIDIVVDINIDGNKT